jgi:nitroreductase
MDRNTIEKIIQAAVQAPSGDNVQPWQFEVSEDFSQLELYNLPERDDSYYNYQQVAAYVAHGAVIENIAITTRHLGCDAKIDLFPSPENPDHVARIRLQPTKAKTDPFYEAIFTRSTNRFHYQNSQLSDSDRQKLADAIGPVEGVTGYFVHDIGTIKALAKALMVNDRLVFERRDIHRFLFDKIRWNQKQIDETQDGMPVDTLGLNGFEKLFFPMMRFWWFVDLANYFGLSRVIGIKCWNNCRNAALIGQITVKNTDRTGFIQAGRALQRVWLEATRQGLAFQPIIGLPLLIYRAKANALAEFSEKHRQMVNKAEGAVRKLCGIDPSAELIVGFRIGKAGNSPAKTLRRPGLKSRKS